MSGRPLLGTLVAIALAAASIMAAPAIGSPSDLGSVSARAVIEGGLLPPGPRTETTTVSPTGSSGASSLNPRKADTDGEGLTDSIELRRTSTNPRLPDTDGDRLTDYTEVNRTHTNPRKADTDGDGIDDGDEVRLGTDPLVPTLIPPPPPGPRKARSGCRRRSPQKNPRPPQSRQSGRLRSDAWVG